MSSKQDDLGGDAASSHFTMRVVERLTGLSAGTVRAWEKRYGAVSPDRSDGNTRRFSQQDVERLRILREAVDRGHSIGAIASLPIDRLRALVEGSTGVAPGAASDSIPSSWIDAYLGAIAELRVEDSVELLTRAAVVMNDELFINEMVLPLVAEVGARWAQDKISIVHEHLVSRQLTSVLDTLLARRSVPRGRPSIILSTPPGHRHEFGVLVAALLAASHGVTPVYLGPDLPLSEISLALRIRKARALVLGVARDLEPEERMTLPGQLDLIANWTELWIGCPEGHSLVTDVPSARFFHDYDAYRTALNAFA